MNRKALVPSLIIALSFVFAGMAPVASAQPNSSKHRVAKKKHVKKAPRRHVKPAPRKPAPRKPVVKQPPRKHVKKPVRKAPSRNVKKARADKNRDGVVTPREKRAAKAKRRQ
tara:strand:- start:19224 stop:19559 length:336 start_codon:yes stop_codon:yes gene_type:complete